MSASVPRKAGFLATGGWVVVAALVVCTLAFAYYAFDILRHRGSCAVGDGRHVESYGFAIEPCLVRRDLIVASGMPKDGLPALVEPVVWTVAQAEAAIRPRKFLVPGDRVIGVRLGGQARAYPLRVLVWHEVVNDALAGRPILVTYNPLCDSAVVFARAVAGRVSTFAFSGLLYDSNLLMYERQPARTGESLWSQLLFRAVTGPSAAAGEALEVLPISVASWGDWRRENPATTVLAPDPRLLEQYSREPYTSYFGSDQLRFPVQPLPPPTLYPLKTPVVALAGPAGWTAFPFPVVASLAQTGPPADAPWAALASALTYRAQGPTVVVSADRLPPGTGVVYASTFAWFATHNGETTWACAAGAQPN
jgi:hypothetical protein